MNSWCRGWAQPDLGMVNSWVQGPCNMIWMTSVHDARFTINEKKAGLSNPHWSRFCCFPSPPKRFFPLTSVDADCCKDPCKRLASESSASLRLEKPRTPIRHPHTPAVGLSTWPSSAHWSNWCCLPKGPWALRLWPNVLDLTKGPGDHFTKKASSIWKWANLSNFITLFKLAHHFWWGKFVSPTGLTFSL